MFAFINVMIKTAAMVIYVGVMLFCIVYLSYIFIPLIVLAAVGGFSYILFQPTPTKG